MLLEGDLASGASALGGFVERLALRAHKISVGYYRSVGLNHRNAQLASDKLPAYLPSQSGRKAGQS